MKKFKNIILVLLLALISFGSVIGAHTLYAVDDDDELHDFSAYKNPLFLFEKKAVYHINMNKFFNEKLEALSTLIDNDPAFQNNVNFITPEGVNFENWRDLCGEKNLSTYCVSMTATEAYIDYSVYLQNLKGKIEPAKTISEALKLSRSRDAGITKEMTDSKKVIIGAAAAYDEYKLAYPMHRKFQVIHESLIKYKIALKKIRDRATQFPVRFIDSSSSDCS